MALTVLHACFLAGYLACGAPKTRDTTWHDSSPHKTLQVWVSPTVQLEVLDWGGSGSSLVFLAGFGNSAHVFDNFAPSFVRNFRVLGITRRGFGASSKPASGYDTASLARDIVTVLDILDIPRASFAAHSFGGSELNYLAVHSPRRVDRLVYLDAAVDHRQLYQTPGWLAAFPTEPPYPSYGDYGGNSIPAWQLWAERLSGPGYPEAELRSMFRLDTKGIVIGRAAADSIERVIQRGTLPAHFNQIRAPALAIYAVAENPQVMFPFWNSLSSAGQARARKNYTVISDAWRRQIERFRREVSHVRMREIPGGRHYVFLTHSGEVRHEMLDFLLADL